MAVSVSLALGACASIEPKPFTGEDLRQQATQNRSDGRQGVEPIKGAISLEEAMARALKYNLDRRVRMMEEALALRQLDVTKLDMLPKILAQAGYSNRNNDYGTRNANGLISGSQERVHTLSELGMSWSLLDLGIGYYSSLQQADRVLVAAEKRRKAMHLLMQDVRVAFWRMASAQRMEGQIRAAIKLSEEALADARKVEESRVRNPVDALRYQRQVLENLRLLEAIAQELSAARVDLAALINAPLAVDLKVIEPGLSHSRTAILKVAVERLEESALVNNADLREQSYNARIAREEARKTLVRLFPNLGFNYTLYYDTDKYLVNDNWNRAGLQLSFNLMNLFTYDTQKKLAEGGVALADLRRVTAQAAVVAQVHLARLQLANANAQLARAQDIYSTDRRLADLVSSREAVQMQSKLERVSAEAAAILSQLRYYQALSQVHAAEARLEATLGVEPVIGSVTQMPLAELTQQLGVAANQNLLQKLQHAVPAVKTESRRATQLEGGKEEAPAVNPAHDPVVLAGRVDVAPGVSADVATVVERKPALVLALSYDLGRVPAIQPAQVMALKGPARDEDTPRERDGNKQPEAQIALVPVPGRSIGNFAHGELGLLRYRGGQQ